MKKQPGAPPLTPCLLDASTVSLHEYLQKCSEKKDLKAGCACYEQLVRSDLERRSFWGDQLIRLFEACGRLPESIQVFDRVLSPTLYTWNAIISAHVSVGDAHGAIRLYHGMQLHCIQPDRITFLCMIKACVRLSDCILGHVMHVQVIEHGLSTDHIIANALIHMLSNVGTVEEARRVFDNLTVRDKISWGALIAGYVHQGHPELALDLYGIMQNDGTKHDRVILLCVAKAVACTGAVKVGRVVHAIAMKDAIESDVMLGSTLIDMYAKCNFMGEARNLFNRLKHRNVVSWGSLIGGFSIQKQDGMVCNLYEQMLQEGVQADRAILLCVLKACGGMGALWQGRILDDLLRKRFLDVDVVLGTALAEMYVLCGSIEDAYKVVVNVHNPNSVIWATLIGGYAICGDQNMVQKCLAAMQQQGVGPDHMIFTHVLASCSHSGSLDVGNHFFAWIGENLRVISSIELYTCMVDLFGRVGDLDAATSLVKTMPFLPDKITWRSLLTGSKVHANTSQVCIPNNKI